MASINSLQTIGNIHVFRGLLTILILLGVFGLSYISRGLKWLLPDLRPLGDDPDPPVVDPPDWPYP